MEDIICMLQCLKEDKGFNIDKKVIKEYILKNIDSLIDEVESELK